MKEQRGGMLLELMLGLALAALMLPFLARQQLQRITRAEQINVSKQITVVKSALEQYMADNQREWTSNVSRNIIRVKIADLEPYGLPDSILQKADKFQLRVVKSADRNGMAVLRGIVVMDNGTDYLGAREIAKLAGDGGGVEDGNQLVGAFGTWRQSTGAVGVSSGINTIGVETRAQMSGDDYIWRIPSDDINDAVMQSAISMGGHSVIDAGMVDAKNSSFSNLLEVYEIAAGKATLANRPGLSGLIEIGDANISGALAADGRGLNISDTLSIDGLARFNGIDAKKLWVSHNMSVSGISVPSTGAAILSIGRLLDMDGGRITAAATYVGFDGSLTPRLEIRKEISDPENPNYFWDVSANTAQFSDLHIPGLVEMMQKIAANEGASQTDGGATVAKTANNSNASVADFVRSLQSMQNTVRAKLNALGL